MSHSQVTNFPVRHAAPKALPPVAPEQQRTLAGSTQCTGVGVHSGKLVTLRLKPGAADSGIVFIRTDLPAGQNAIAAQWDKVVDTRLCTVLANDQGAMIGTVEHVLAALRAMNIDNAVIEVDGAEVPIMDGSAAPFTLLVEMAGIRMQGAPRRWIEVLKPVSVMLEGKTATLQPADQASFAVEIRFDSAVIGTQRYECALTAPGFKGEVSRARTFGFLEEVAQLRKLGLAQGGSLDNAVVIGDGKVLNDGGLRYRDEFARHKLLDAVGDLSLAGAPIKGAFTGICTGHALNNKLLHALFADRSAWRFVTRPDEEAIAMLTAAE